MPTKKRSTRVKLFANVNHVLDTLEMNSANLVSEYYHQVATTGLVPHGFKAAQPTSTDETSEAPQQMTMMNTIDDLDALYANLDKC
ncbi:hypothetical protein [Lactiplantibacillus songbeiensis]|uniref:Uncharacterized protein n=1 Tax=Lactiplantibacillus songbeiensis TaxID=2559920 RepID=A0ABW4C3I2_9LACO|nr:hypothetical protein [Lactiplantibacillus songbeiensis]